jgi:hypothetical protein
MVLRDEKILITGPAGRIASGFAAELAADNDVWGVARFSDPAARERVEGLGVTTRALDLADGDFGDLPGEFTYLLHLAADFSADDYERALRVSGLPAWHLQAIADGQPVQTRWYPMPYSPIHDDDIAAQLEPLLDAASVPATVVNWCGDQAVSVQEWSAYFGALLGVDVQVEVTEAPGASIGSVGDHRKRASITGPCTVDWRDGFRALAQQFVPGRVMA